MIKQNRRALIIILALTLMFACAPIAAPVAPPTMDPQAINTTIAQTAGAAATQTFVLLPTLTLEPTSTRTPTKTPTSTPTFIFILPTSTVPTATPTINQSGAKFDCQILSKSPADDTSLNPGMLFNASWEVLNIGAAAWDSNNMDYHYINGDKLHTSAIYDLNESVAPGGKTVIVVNMKAPKDKGTYSTVWALRSGKNEFCRMKLTIKVN